MVKKYMAISIIVLIILIGMLLYFGFSDKENIPEKPEEEIISEKEEEEILDFDFDISLIEKINILGNWKAISEEFLGDKYEIEGSIEFKDDGSYVIINNGIEEKGVYVLDKEKVIFYDSKEDIGKEGRFNEGLIGIEDGKLKILFILYPKVVVYEKF